MKFRKKPVVIEAVEVTAADYNPRYIDSPWDGCPFSEIPPEWLCKAVDDGTVTPHNRGGSDYAQWDIKTLEGTMTAQPGDYIIRGIKGELYPCRGDIFEATYEPAE